MPDRQREVLCENARRMEIKSDSVHEQVEVETTWRDAIIRESLRNRGGAALNQPRRVSGSNRLDILPAGKAVRQGIDGGTFTQALVQRIRHERCFGRSEIMALGLVEPSLAVVSLE